MPSSSIFPELIRVIAEGASSVVHEGRDHQGRAVAVKIARSAEFDGTILREIKAAEDLKHEALLEILDGGRTEEGRRWLSMPLLTGQTLATWSAPVPELLHALAPIADLLDLMHERGWGHADLKSENILLDARTSTPRLVLSDLGFISPLGQIANGGSPAFLSTHRLDGGVLRRQDDVHAFGVLVFEGICGRLPWTETSGDLLLRAIRSGATVAPSIICPDLPLALDTLFSRLFSSGSQQANAMGWLDTVRDLFGLEASIRSVFLEDDTEALPRAFRSRDELSKWIGSRLRSANQIEVTPNHEVTRTLEDLMGGDPEQLTTLLAWLVGERLLRCKSGLALFDRPAPAVRSLWQESRHGSGDRLRPLEASIQSILTRYGAALQVDDLVSWLHSSVDDVSDALNSLRERSFVNLTDDGLWRSVMIVPDLDLTDLPVPEPSMLDDLWCRNSAQPAQRVRLLILAISSGVGGWLGSLDHDELIALGNALPDELVDDLHTSAEAWAEDTALRVPVGILTLFREFRADRLDVAIELFWFIEPELNLEASGELNRVLVYHLAAHGRLRDADLFLERWKADRDRELPGTLLEIKIAAREISVLSRFGELKRAAVLGQEYVQRFEGRPGLWSLHMALANLAADNMDRPERVMHTELALEGLRREGSGGKATELELLIFLMGGVILWGDPERIASIESIRKKAGVLAQGLVGVVDQQQLLAEDALLAQFRGDAVRAQNLLSKVLESARRSGELRRVRFAELQLFNAHRDQGDYRSCAAWMETLSEPIEQREDVLNVLLARDLIIEWSLIIGNLDAAERELDTSLPAARELGNRHVTGNLLFYEAQMRRLQGKQAEAAETLTAAIDCFEAMGMVREIAHSNLEAIIIDSGADPSGERIANVISYQIEVRDPRPLPLAWRLEAARLRRLGDLETAALALEQSFAAAEPLGNPDRIWPIHLEAAELALAAGERDAARAELRRALDINRDLSLHFPTGPERELFLARPDRAAVLTKLRALEG